MSALPMVWIAVALACALVGMAIGDRKGRGAQGFWLGLVLGIFGVVIVAVLSPTPDAQARTNHEMVPAVPTLYGEPSLRPCPWCAEQIQPAAIICRYCGRDVEPIAVPSFTTTSPTALPAPPPNTHAGWLHDPSRPARSGHVRRVRSA